MRSRTEINTILAAVLALGALFPKLALAKEKWKPATPEELALKAPTVEPDAGAEAIFWERKIEDELHVVTLEPLTYTTVYLRVKIFDERGQKAFSKIDIEYEERGDVSDVFARTIKPDGSIVELAKDAIFERSIVKAGGKEVRAKSFAPPALAPGVIVEWQYRERALDTVTNYVRVDFQREIPVQRAAFSFRPLSLPGFGVTTRSFRCKPSPFVRNGDLTSTTVVMSQPAFHEEPWSPPDLVSRAWMLVYYTDREGLTADEYWKEWGKQRFEAYKPSIKPNGDVKKLAAKALVDVADPGARLRRLWEVAREKVKPTKSLTKEARAKRRANESAGDTLDAGVGTASDVNELFAALAAAAGFEVRVAAVADRDTFFFRPDSANGYFLPGRLVAVKSKAESAGGTDTWSFYAPGDRNLPFGSLRWQNEGQAAFLFDGKQPGWVMTPSSAATASVRKRTATLALQADGTLAGSVRSEHHGHHALDRRDEEDDRTPEARVKDLKESLEALYPGIEISNPKIEGIDVQGEPDKLGLPVVYSYDVRIPGYASRTGKRLLVAPGFFRRGVGPRFPSATRVHDVYLRRHETEEDEVRLTLPEGFRLEDPSWPSGFTVGSTGQFTTTVSVSEDQRSVVYSRMFRLAGGVFPVSSYAQLKNVFDRVHEADQQTLSLREAKP